MKALIKVDYACNNRCVFCHSAEHRGRAPAAVGVAHKIRLAAERGCTMVVLSGGEPTMQPRLLTWAQAARRAGLALGLVTNGRMLAYEDLVSRLRDQGLAYAQLSLHGHTAALHDKMTRAPGSFTQGLRAMELLLAAGVELTVNAVVTATNLDRLDGLADLLEGHAELRLKVSMVEPKGAALEAFDQVVPPLSRAAQQVSATLLRARARQPRRLAHEGFPLCLVDHRLRELACDLRTEGFAFMSEADEHDLVPVDAKNRTQPEPCAACELAPGCFGVYRQYLARRAVDLRPERGGRS